MKTSKLSLLAAVAVMASALVIHAEEGKRDYKRLAERCEKAASIVNALKSEKDIPQSVLNQAKGIAVMRITKGGFVVSGSDGKGVVVARTANGWSAPLAFSSGGAGLGFQAGGEESDIIFVLNSKSAVDKFMSGDSFKLGADATATAGSDSVKEGASTGSDDVTVYRKTGGAFAGVAFHGADVSIDKETNRKAYGTVSATQILSGEIPKPSVAKPLYDALEK